MITDMTTTATTRTRRGSGFASPGAVKAQGETLPVYICNGCQSEVVWAESKRTGRRYLVSVSTGRSGQRYFIGANVHKCEDAESKQRRHEVEQLTAEIVLLEADLADSTARLAKAIEDGKGSEIIEIRRESVEHYTALIDSKRADLDRLS